MGLKLRVRQFGDSWKLRRGPSCSDSKVSKNISKPQPNIHSPDIISDNLTGTKMEAEEDGPGAARVLLAKAKCKCDKENFFSLTAKY